MTAPCASGMSHQGQSCAALKGTQTRSRPVPLRPMARPFSRQAMTTPCASGMSPQGHSCAALRGTEDMVRSCTFAPDGKTILSAGYDNTLRLRDVASGALLRSFEGTQAGSCPVPLRPMARPFYRQAMTAPCASGMSPQGHSCAALEGTQARSRPVPLRPMGKTILSASYDNTLRLWDVASGALLRSFEGHTGAVTSCAFAPDGKTMLSASDDNTLCLWDVRLRGTPAQL